MILARMKGDSGRDELAERFAKNIVDIAGETIERDVMKGGEKLGSRPTP